VRRWAAAGAVLLAASCRAPAPERHAAAARAWPPVVKRAVERAVVDRVVDGDTVVLRVRGRRVRVRLIGMDAPETWLRRDCFGAEATRALRRLIPPGSPVYAAGDAEPYDRYGRRLLYLWTARGELVEAVLIRRGFARTLEIPPDTAHAVTLRAAEAVARRARAGLWKACP
jgi:micrococcal nuclease